jgi:pyruvate formate lyase activating enzyme
LDTSGFTNSSILEHIIPWTDLFLFDYKLSKEEDYCQHTKMNLETINQSLKLLFQYGKQIILRCPIIPCINDNEMHFDSIRSIAMQYPNIRQVDIIPYHQLGEQKHIHIGNKKSFKTNKSVNFEKVELMQKKLENQLAIPIVLSKDYAH